MKTFVVLMSCILVAQAFVSKTDVEKEWKMFNKNFQKSYENEVEKEFRFKIFRQNLETIYRHNQEHKEGKATFTMAVNKFADMLESEVIESRMGLNVKKTKAAAAPKSPTKGDLPATVDWRDQGAVTGVKDQGSCGSCWAFSATGSLEGQHFLKNGELVSLSEQNLVDCSRKYGNLGCFGGWMDSGFDYIIDNGGIDTEDSYPYEAKNGDCRYNQANVGATVSGYVDLPQGDEAALQEAVATVGPISVAINANMAFQLYNGGVFKSSFCSPSGLNHGVLVVGYGVEDGEDYWLVKNSWGDWWGENGYIKMARNYNNMCGISEAASYPTV